MNGSTERAVLDTNIYISALFGGNPEEVYLAVLQGRFQIVTSPAILTELARTLREKFSMPEAEITGYIRQIGRYAEIVRPLKRHNRILECALAGKASVIVSVDRHLLDLREYQGIPILRPAGSLGRLEASQ